jgi:hypothetical protein
MKIGCSVPTVKERSGFSGTGVLRYRFSGTGLSGTIVAPAQPAIVPGGQGSTGGAHQETTSELSIERGELG